MRGFFRKHYLIILILFLGFFLRFYHLGLPVLNTDEAEVYLVSQSIFEGGVPRGFYKLQLYENAYLFESNSSMYEFEPTNYYKSDLVLKKGWFPYYLTAFVSLFGKSEFLLRFPFALISVISLFFFFKLSNLLFNKRTAFIASFFYAISPSLLFYERVVRYYSPMLLFLILSLYFYVKAFKDCKRKDYFLGAISLTLLFYTNILIFLSLAIVLFIYWLVMKTGFSRELIYSTILAFVLIVPWRLGTGFLWKFVSEPGSITEPVFQSIVAGINNQGSLYIFFYLGIVVLLINIFFKKIISKTFFYWKNKNSNYLILISLFSFIIIPYLLAPPSSFEEKLFLSLIPFSLILIAKLFDSFMNFFNNKNIKCIILTFIILISIIHVDSSFGYKGHNFLTLKNIINNYKSAFYSEINNLIKNQTDENPLILTTSEQFPLMFYTDYAVQIVWPVRKSFIDNSDEELFIIETGAVEGTCNFFYQYVDSNSRCNANKNYLERIKDCENMVVDASTTIYYCKERTKFIGGGLGLFFPDFPSGYPPDFIWDQVPFPVAINVNNLGEYDVNKLKVVFNGNFNSREFDAEKQEFVFEDVLHGQHKVLGEVISSKKLFELGNLTFNHKLASKSRIVNASVKICYSYTTMIMVKICDDSKAICGLDVSGAPIQLENISYNQLGFNFSIKNSAEGSLGSFQFCSAEKIEEVKVFSDYFKCTEFNELFSCLGQNIFEGNTYLVNISYDYQQEFDKSILLRSKELNKYDYENFYKEE